ncbi:histidine kinase [Tamlana fucoidanivorans]|uniref:sensor histidine kinase n=1 Tax=Allotamlana fucoidanivorans TaxID=2583814 RepID=UPI0013052988|nr:histidine kinase [Tamlana fucoidanivorans]
MKFKKAKQYLLIGIAVLISFLINLPRFLGSYEVIERLSNPFSEVTVKDIILRTLFLILYTWFILQVNANWKLLYSKINVYLKNIIWVFSNVFIYLIGVYLLIYFRATFTGEYLSELNITLIYIVYAVITLLGIFIARIIRYQMEHQGYLAEKEILKQQSLRNELDALKNQINPHFLFNSLNSLNSLIRENKQATTFVNKLSFLYRYILQSESGQLATLKEELKFLESYIYLIKTRYRNRFDIDITLNESVMEKKIATLALQLLVENAIKHNEISETNPLLVKVYAKDDYIVVENTVRPRTTFVDSTGNGLPNLDKRYQILFKENIVVSHENQTFKVKLPLK